MLVSLGEKVLRCLEGFSFVVGSDGMLGPDAVQLWVNFNDMTMALY